MLTGIEILEQKEVAASYDLNINALIFIIIIYLAILTLASFVVIKGRDLDKEFMVNTGFIGIFLSTILCICLAIGMCLIETKTNEYIIAISEETDMKELYKNFDVVDSNGEILTIREKEPDKIKTSENVHGEQLHNWSVMEKRDKEDTVEYVLQCSECNQEKIIVRQKETN